MTRASAISLLRNPVFARLWFIQAANQVGGNMALYAMTILVFDTTRSNAAVSVLFATYVVPQIVLSPFAGIGSEGFEALRWGRRFVGVELKDSYFAQAVLNLRGAESEKNQLALFA